MFARFGLQVRQQYAGFLALFVALGGVSYAAVALPMNSVGSKQIKKGAVKTADLGKSAVTAAKVKNGSLLKKDFKAGELEPGATGPQGLPGAKGDIGAAGATGPAGTTGSNGSAGTARAYGLVSGAGVLDAAVRKNATVIKIATGVYSIVLDPSIDASTTFASATPALGSNINTKLRSIRKSDAGTCVNEPNAVAIHAIQTHDGTNASFSDEPFFFLVP
jgi:hypothetical protein